MIIDIGIGNCINITNNAPGTFLDIQINIIDIDIYFFLLKFINIFFFDIYLY